MALNLQPCFAVSRMVRSARAGWRPERASDQAMPAQPGALIGRDAERAALTARLLAETARLITITGPAGAGKTRLALAVAAEVESSFRDGAVFVDLSVLREPDLVMLAIARALHVRESTTQPVLRALEAHLRARHLLLVLDNWEQVLPAGRNLAVLLESCPGLTVLATSREPLRLRWEERFPLAPLRVPDDRKRPRSLARRASE